MEARRRCYMCRRAICPACQQRESSHIFCGSECLGEFRRVERRKKLEALNQGTHRTAWGRLLFYGPIAILAAAILVLTMWAPDYWLQHYGEVELPNVRRHDAGPHTDRLDWATPAPLRFEGLPALLEVPGPQIALRGVAPRNAIVGLFVNGRQADVMLANGGTFSFDAVPVVRGANLVQARAFDDAGRPWDSPAHLVTALSGAEVLPGPEPGAEGTPPALETDLEGDAGVQVAEAGAPRDITRLRAAGKRVALTFDGGSNNSSVDTILTLLKSRDLQCTMFLTGDFISQFPQDVQRMVADGHEVGNHTLNHPHLTSFSFDGRHRTLRGVTADFLSGQLDRTNQLFRSVTGQDMAPLWRAPFGERNPEVNRWAEAAGFTQIAWTGGLDSLDWVADRNSRLYGSPDQTLKRLLGAEQRLGGFDGAIFLFHLGTDRRHEERMDRMLPDLLDELERRGYRPVKVGELLEASGG